MRSRIFGSAPHPAIPYRLRLNGSAAGAESHVPFMHVAGLVMGPILVRREVFVRIGGFDESYSRVGEPGIGFDMELGLRLWTLGSRVGLYYAGVGNGVGGHKSRRDPRRRRNDRLNTRRIMELWSAHNQSIRAAVASANSELVASSALATVSAEPPRRREVRVRDPALGCRAAT